MELHPGNPPALQRICCSSVTAASALPLLYAMSLPLLQNTPSSAIPIHSEPPGMHAPRPRPHAPISRPQQMIPRSTRPPPCVLTSRCMYIARNWQAIALVARSAPLHNSACTQASQAIARRRHPRSLSTPLPLAPLPARVGALLLGPLVVVVAVRLLHVLLVALQPAVLAAVEVVVPAGRQRQAARRLSAPAAGRPPVPARTRTGPASLGQKGRKAAGRVAKRTPR